MNSVLFSLATLPGGDLEDGPASGSEGRASCGGAIPASGLHRDSVAYLADLP
jgi:hypothetical protein